MRAAEARLAAAGICSRGCADGDLALGAYTSLRNEAFVPHVVPRQRCDDGIAAMARVEASAGCGSGKRGWGKEQVELVYPHNQDGWNAADHLCPLPIFQMRCAATGLGVCDRVAGEAEEGERARAKWVE